MEGVTLSEKTSPVDRRLFFPELDKSSFQKLRRSRNSMVEKHFICNRLSTVLARMTLIHQSAERLPSNSISNLLHYQFNRANLFAKLNVVIDSMMTRFEAMVVLTLDFMRKTWPPF